MKFTINSATFCRMASIPAFFEPGTDPEIQQQLSCVRLENNKGKVIAIATNQKIAAIEYLGTTNESDGSVHVTIDPVLINQLKKEIPFNSFIEVVFVPEILTASVKTMLGFSYQGNASVGIPDQSILKNWRTWFPVPSKNSKGAMYWNVDHINVLAKSSPSGKIIFPENINTDIPIIIRDVEFAQWVGCFMAKVSPIEQPPIPATIPEWM